jgi:nucleotide-binding universal stress UspA family protein
MTTRPLNLLVPVDGSDGAERAVDYALLLCERGVAADIHLLNVQHPLPGAVSTFVGSKAVSGYHHDEGMKALAGADAKLHGAKVPHHLHIVVGQPADMIVAVCEEQKCEGIVMGTRGHGKAVGLLLGSVARDVIARAPVPVTVVK